jgi:hypothetical protein
MNEHDRQHAGEDALREVRATGTDAPQREAMLAQVYLRASQHKEQDMTGLHRLFSGRPLAVQLGLVAVLLLALGALVLLQGEPSLAATEGQILIYDLSGRADAEAVVDQIKAAKSSLTVPEGTQLEIKKRLEVRREKRIVKRDGVEAAPEETEVRNVAAVVLLSNADAQVVADVRSALERAVPGLPVPQQHDSTWFSENGAPFGEGITVKLGVGKHEDGAVKEHVFNFPKGTSSEQVKSEINNWLAQNHPDMHFDVDVAIGGDGQGEQQVEIKIVGKGDHAEESGR